MRVTSAPTSARATAEGPQGALPSARAGWLAVVLAALYPLIEAIRLIAESRPTVRYGDTALMDLSAARAAHLDQLVGPYSREGFHHPGPVSFYIMGPFVRALGSGQGDYLANILVSGTCMVAAAALIWRWVGSTVALWTVAALGVWVLCLHPFTLREPWNPYQVVAPMALLGVLAAGAATGRRGAWVWALVAGSYGLQTHISTAPTVVVLLLLPILPMLWRLRQRRTAPIRPSAGAAIGWVAFVSCWVPVVIELFADKPNNLRLLWDFYGHSHPDPSAHQALTAAANALAIIPFGNTDYVLTINRPDWKLAFVLVGMVVIALCTLVLARLRRQPLAVAFAAAATVVAVVGALGLTRASGGINAYFATWMAASPLLLLIGLGVGLLGPRPGAAAAAAGDPTPVTVARSPARRPRTTPVALASVSILAVTTVALCIRSDLHMEPATEAILAPQVAAGQFARQIEARHPKGAVALHIESRDSWPFVAGVVLELYRHHIRSTVSPATWVLYFGKQNRPDQPSVLTYSFYTTDAAQAAHVNPTSVVLASDGMDMVAGPPPPGVRADSLP